MITSVLQYLAAGLMVIGALFSLLSAVGVLRLPDLYTRMHAASKAGAVGAGLVLLSLAVSSGDSPVILRAILGILFLLLTAPVSALLLARAAYRTGHRPASATIINDLDRETGDMP